MILILRTGAWHKGKLCPNSTPKARVTSWLGFVAKGTLNAL